MKLLLYIILFFLSLVFACFFFFFEVGENEIRVRAENRPLLAAIAGKLNEIIYDEATKHNPAGDLVPDELDERVKEKLKNTLDPEKEGVKN